jgi:hypothetical protein
VFYSIFYTAVPGGCQRYKHGFIVVSLENWRNPLNTACNLRDDELSAKIKNRKGEEGEKVLKEGGCSKTEVLEQPPWM